jgi:Peptidase family S41
VLTEAFDVAEAADRCAALGRVGALADFAPERRPLTRDEMQVLAERALVLLRDFYVHLPMKRVVHAADPERRLRVLLDRLVDAPPLAEEEFHRALGEVFTELRDRHTTYILPQPYRSAIAFLPFLVEEVADPDGGRRFIVSRVSWPFADGAFRRSTVTHWNGIPIERAVELNAERNAGANRWARRARGLDRLTFRWLGLGVRPDEDWVVVSYLVDGAPRHLRFPWLVAERPAWEPPLRSGAAVDREGEWIRRVKTRLLASEQPDEDRLVYRPAAAEHGCGHLRIFSFDLEDHEVEAFVARIVAELERDRPNGLIIDVRGNPGGDLVAAERLVQLFCPVRVTPEGLEFINTAAGRDLADRYFADRPEFAGLSGEARATATPYVTSLPLEERGSYNDIGQVFQGPVAVLVDGLTYSAAEVFAAGMQDHGAATILGTSGQSGGGGANVWSYDDVRAARPAGLPLGRLPWESSFDVAIRRMTRVGPRAGVPLEELGVVAEAVHAPTPADVLGRNEELLAFAVERLRGTRRRLEVSYDGERRRFEFVAEGVERVDGYADGHPIGTLAYPQRRELPLPDDAEEPRSARFEGFAGGEKPVVSARWPSG